MSTLSIHVPVSKAAAVIHSATAAAVRLLIEECRILPEAVKECRQRCGGDEAAARAELAPRLPMLTAGCIPPDLRPVLLLSSVCWETVAEAVCRTWDRDAVARYEVDLRDDIEAMLLQQETERAAAELAEAETTRQELAALARFDATEGDRWDGLG